jgi:hypothetical protein
MPVREEGAIHHAGRVHENDHVTSKPGDLNWLAGRATNHCLTGCAIGEVAGMTIATALAWGNVETIALSVVLAFVFGYALTSLRCCGRVSRLLLSSPLRLQQTRCRSQSWS